MVTVVLKRQHQCTSHKDEAAAAEKLRQHRNGRAKAAKEMKQRQGQYGRDQTAIEDKMAASIADDVDSAAENSRRQQAKAGGAVI